MVVHADGSNKLASNADLVADRNSFTITGGDSGNGSVRSSAGNDASGIPAGTTYVVNKNTGKFHYITNTSMPNIASEYFFEYN